MALSVVWSMDGVGKTGFGLGLVSCERWSYFALTYANVFWWNGWMVDSFGLLHWFAILWGLEVTARYGGGICVWLKKCS